MGNTVFIVFHLLQRNGNDFRERVAVVSGFEVFPHKCTKGMEKISRDNNIPVFAVISFFPVKMVNVGLVQEDDISGMEGLGLAIEGVGNGTFQNIEYFVEPVRVNDLITVFRDFGTKWLRRVRHPIVKHEEIHQKHPQIQKCILIIQ